MPILFAGVGGFVERDGAGTSMRVVSAKRFSLSVNYTTVVAQSYPDCDVGILQDSGTIRQSASYTATLESDRFDDQTLSWILDQKIDTSLTGQTIARTVCGTVPAAGGDVATITGLSDTVTDSVQLLVFNPSQTEQTSAVALAAGATGAAGAPTVSAADTINFDAADAGKPFVVSFKQTGVALPKGAIGGPSAEGNFGTREILGRVKRIGSPAGETWNIWLANVTPDGTLDFDTTADTLAYSYRVAIAEGWKKPYFAWLTP